MYYHLIMLAHNQGTLDCYHYVSNNQVEIQTKHDGLLNQLTNAEAEEVSFRVICTHQPSFQSVIEVDPYYQNAIVIDHLDQYKQILAQAHPSQSLS